MKTTPLVLIASAGLFFLAGSGLATQPDDPLFRAMKDELDRSMKELVIPGMPAPYFLSYRIRESRSHTVEARYTALDQSEHSTNRELYIELRVGDADLDNTNFYENWQDIWNRPERLPVENDYDALRHEIWYQTDLHYKSALEKLARKKAYLQTHPVKDPLSDFSPAEPYGSLEPIVTTDKSDKEREEIVRRVARSFAEFPELQDWRVLLQARAMTQWYVNSEGSQHRKGAAWDLLEMSATAQADDGERLTGFLQYAAREGVHLPPTEELVRDVRGMASDLERAVAAPVLESYAGPVLFTGRSAAQCISLLFAKQLTLARKPLFPDDWMSRYLPEGKLATRLKRRILPSFISIADQPGLSQWRGIPLVGFQTVDDEGVQSLDLSLVEKGRLVAIPMGRQPIKEITRSNGHSRSLPQELTFPGITNLIVSTSQSVPFPKLKKELTRLCREQETEFGLLITCLDEARYSDQYRWVENQEESPPLLPAPLLVYKVYAKDGRMEPVRGLAFDEISFRSLRDIAAMGDDANVFNLLQPAPISDVFYPVSIVTPSILVEEMELKAGGQREPHPVGGNPIFP